MVMDKKDGVGCVIRDDWENLELGKIATKITKGSTPTTYGYKFQDTGINFIKVENVKNGVIMLNSIINFISTEAHDNQKRSKLKEGDILFSIAGTIGETCLVHNKYLPANTNQAFAIINGFNRVLLPEFLIKQLESFVVISVKNRARGGAMNNVSLGDLKSLPVVIPPLPIQRAIVSKIEALFSDLDNGIADLKKAQDQLKIYRQAVLKKAFEGELTKEWRETQTDLPTADELLEQIKEERHKHYEQQLEEWKQAVFDWEKEGKEGKKPGKPKSLKELIPFLSEELKSLPEISKDWLWCKIDKISGHEVNALKAGPFGSSLKKEFYTPEGYKIYGQEQVISGNAKFGDYYVNEDKYFDLINCAVFSSDILISLVGTVGRVLILPSDAEKGIINPRLVKITLNRFYDPVFFKYYFESNFLKSLYKLKNHGTTMDVLNLTIIKELPYLLCSVKEQHQIVREIESRLSICDKVELNIAEALEKSEALRQSILKKAFQGTLLSEEEIIRCKQEADYEPARVLLERIKKEKAGGK